MMCVHNQNLGDWQRYPGFPRLLESPGFSPKISRTWKVLENEFGPG